MAVDDPDLEARLLAAMETLRSEADAVRDAIGRTVVSNLKRMARMGPLLEQNVRERHPGVSDRWRRKWKLGRGTFCRCFTLALEKLAETYGSRKCTLASAG